MPFGASGDRVWATSPQLTASLAGATLLQSVTPAAQVWLAGRLIDAVVAGIAAGGTDEPVRAIAVIEDVMTSGGSAIKAAQVLSAAGCRITRLIGVIDREEGAAEAARAAGYELVSVFSRSELERYLDRSA